MSNLREIASKTGLSVATVSLALRGVGRISNETRTRVKKAANELEYQPIPLLSKALSLARQPESARYRETLACLTEFSLTDPSLTTYPEYQKCIVEGAESRAKELGYQLESFVVSGKPSEHRRLGKIFEARGIRGLIIVPRVRHNQPRLDFKWEHFGAVEIGRTLWHPRNLHHVETADYPKIIEALHLLKKAGYQRIGMAIEPNQNKHQKGVYYAAYLLGQLRQAPQKRIPIAASTGPWCEETFRTWMKQYKPDVLIIHDRETVRWLDNLGMRAPADVSLFCINAQDKKLSGLRRDYHGIGRRSVEMASLLLESQEMGLTENPRCWQVDEFWQVGTTLERSISPFLSDEGYLLPQHHRQHQAN